MAGGGFDGDDVHAVDLFAGQPIGRRLASDVGFRFGPLDRHAHRVEIVLANEKHGELP